MKVKLLVTVWCVFYAVGVSRGAFNYKKVFGQVVSDALRDVTSAENLDLANFFSLRFPERPLQKEYDFIVVGSGPAGCVVASRLSEDGKYSVLIVEAGSSESPVTSDIPISSPNLQSTSFNWGYTTTVQDRACLGMDNQRCHWPHGKVLGGSSILYYMIYTRGNRRDFDKWARAGNPGWSWNEVLPYFMRSENATLQYAAPFTHGTEGPLPVEDVPFRSPISYAHVQAAQEAGYRYVDYNSGDQIGVSFLQQSTRRGRRISAARAYLYPARFRRNLQIATHSTVKRLIIEQNNQGGHGGGRHSVKGVVLRQLNHPNDMVVRARKEVILSAGAFESPKLLMLSGVGPARHLASLGIKPIRDLPVGQTLFEHMGVMGPVFTVPKVNDGLINLERILTVKNVVDYLHGRGGPMTMNGVESLTYIKTNGSADPDPGFPDVEIMQAFASVAFDTGGGTAAGIRLRTEIDQEVFRPLENTRAFFYLPMLLHPRSSGFMQLRSKDPADQPLFEPNFFQDPRDLEVLVAGMEEAIRLAGQPSMQKLGARVYTPELSTCPDVERGSRDYWRCWAMTISATFHHQVGTCKMGPEDDPTTVVNHQLLVHGFENLRVADIGIIPEPPSGHTNAYSYLIGEKASDMIRQAWKAPRPPHSLTDPESFNSANQNSYENSVNFGDYFESPQKFDLNYHHRRFKRSAGFDWEKGSREEVGKKLEKMSRDRPEQVSQPQPPSSSLPEQLKGNGQLPKSAKGVISSPRVSDLPFILRPSRVDISHRSLDDLPPDVIPLPHEKEKSALAEVLEMSAPVADEDAIRTVQLEDGGGGRPRGKNKPQIITEKLATLVNTTEFDEKDFPADKSTKAIHLPVLDGKLDHPEEEEKPSEEKNVNEQLDTKSEPEKEGVAKVEPTPTVDRIMHTLNVYTT